MDQPPAIVLNDPGGYVWVHRALGQKYAKEGTHLIVAYCASACLDILAIVPRENVCFRPSAWIGHHTPAQHANVSNGTCCVEDPNTMRWERGLDWIARGYSECR